MTGSAKTAGSATAMPATPATSLRAAQPPALNPISASGSPGKPEDPASITRKPPVRTDSPISSRPCSVAVGTPPADRPDGAATIFETNVTLSFEEAYQGTTRGVNITHHETCPTCHGARYVREQPCPTCDTTGTVPKRSTLEVRIPPGIATGQSVRVAGKGEPGINGGPNGDVYLRVTVANDARFERQGD